MVVRHAGGPPADARRIREPDVSNDLSGELVGGDVPGSVGTLGAGTGRRETRDRPVWAGGPDATRASPPPPCAARVRCARAHFAARVRRTVGGRVSRLPGGLVRVLVEKPLPDASQLPPGKRAKMPGSSRMPMWQMSACCSLRTNRRDCGAVERSCRAAWPITCSGWALRGTRGRRRTHDAHGRRSIGG